MFSATIVQPVAGAADPGPQRRLAGKLVRERVAVRHLAGVGLGRLVERGVPGQVVAPVVATAVVGEGDDALPEGVEGADAIGLPVTRSAPSDPADPAGPCRRSRRSRGDDERRNEHGQGREYLAHGPVCSGSETAVRGSRDRAATTPYARPVSILDDAREGMDPTSGRRTTFSVTSTAAGSPRRRSRRTGPAGVPSSSWPTLRAAGPRHHHRSRGRLPTTAATDDRRGRRDAARSPTSTTPSWTPSRSTALASTRSAPLLEQSSALRDVRDLAAFLGEFERIGGGGLFGSYVNTDDRNSDRYLFHLGQGGLGLPDESYYRDEKFAEVRTAYVAYLTKLLELGGHDDAAGAAQRILDLETRLAAGHWERAETRDVQKTYNLLTADELKALCPAFDWAAYVTGLGGHLTASTPRSPRSASGSRPTSSTSPRCSTETPIEVWRDWMLQPGAAVGGGVPHRRLRRDQLRLLRPHPQRHPGAAGALEARVSVRRGGDGRGRRQGVRRPPLPARVQGDDGRAGRQPARGLPRPRSPRWTG